MSVAPCAVIPVFNHHNELRRLVGSLREQGLPVFLADDGSGADTRAVLDELARAPGVTLLRHPRNLGKGRAVLGAIAEAGRHGFTHAVQIDADGQHDPAEAASLLELARAHPHALVSGTPAYDESVPWVRYYGRWLTHLLVWVETLSRELVDSMCGFRVYPVAETVAVSGRESIGARMDFDTDVMVRLHLHGVRVVFHPVAVRYPADGVSHFRMLRDNARMTWLHLRLLAGLLGRMPRRLWQRRRR